MSCLREGNLSLIEGTVADYGTHNRIIVIATATCHHATYLPDILYHPPLVHTLVTFFPH